MHEGFGHFFVALALHKADGQADEGVLAEGGIDQPAEDRAARDRADIEEARGHRGRRKNISGVQHPHHQSGQ